MMDLREYQAKSVEEIIDYALAHPSGRLLAVCPPGGGKTLITATVLRILAATNKLPALVVGHRREMVDHHYNHLIQCGIPESMLGVIMGTDKRSNPAALIQIASIDTLNRRNKPPAYVLATDEAHRDASKSRRKLRALYPDAFRLGMTATPTRLDGKGLRQDFDDLLVISSISELIADGFLSAPRVFTVPPELLPDLTQVRTLAGEFEPDTLDRAVNRKALVGSIVEHWKRSAKNRRTVVFAASIKHSKYIVEQFVAAGVPAAHLDQDASHEQRKTIIGDLEAGHLRVVSCVNILAEGWDCPPCKCVIQARPTKSLNLHIQQTGRCMRPWEAVVPLILDHAGNMVQHGLPQMEREWSLDGDDRVSGGKAPAKMCVQCNAVVPAGAHECYLCGYEFPHNDRVLDEKPGTLVEVDRSGRDQELARIRAFAARKGFSPEWAMKVYHAKFPDETT